MRKPSRKLSVVSKAIVGLSVCAMALPAMAHIRYLDLNQNLRIRELTAAGITLMGNNVPISDSANWNATYQTAQASTETWGTVTGSYASGTWSTSVRVVNIDSSGWTDGMRTDPNGGANVLGDTHTVNFANFHLSQPAIVSITFTDELGGTGKGLNPSFTLFAGSAVYGAHDDAAVDPKNPTDGGVPPAKIQSSKDDGTVVDSQGITSPYRNTLTNTGVYYGQFNALADYSAGNSTGQWNAVHYLTSVTGTVNPDGTWEGNANSNSLLHYSLPAGDYVIAFGANAQPLSYATGRSAATTSPYGVVTGQAGTLSVSIVATVPLPDDIAGAMKNAKTGSSVAFAGDVNGDAYGDYVIGIPGYDIPATSNSKIIKDAGRAEVISGKTGLVLASINGAAAKDALGTAVAGGADVDGDGFDDVVIGAPFADGALKDVGSVTVLYGGLDDSRTPSVIYGTQAKSLFGSAIALGNTHGDNRAEIIIGAPKADDLRNAENKLIDAGSVAVFSVDGLLDPVQTFYGIAAKAYAGSAVAAGEVDAADGADIIIGAPNENSVSGLKSAGSVTVYNVEDNEINVLKKFGAAANAHFGKAVASGDVTKDGFDDVLVGAPDEYGFGSITLFSGSNGSGLTKKYGATAKTSLGNSVAIGDTNADGFADLIAGAWKDDKAATPKAIKDTGSVSIWSGNGYSLLNTLYGDATSDYFGTAVSVGDIDSNGKSDLIIGIPGKDISATKLIRDGGVVTVR